MLLWCVLIFDVLADDFEGSTVAGDDAVGWTPQDGFAVEAGKVVGVLLAQQA